MKKNVLVLMSATATDKAAAKTATWQIDKSHSQVHFSVNHLMISEVHGSFSAFDAQVDASKDDFSDAVTTFTIDVDSINTHDSGRDQHLKSDDFFNAGQFPQMVFKSKFLEKTGDNTYLYTGDLTIRDITKLVTLNVEYLGQAKDPWGQIKAGFKITGKINRFDYNLKWNTLTEAGGMVVGKEVSFRINLQLVKS